MTNETTPAEVRSSGVLGGFLLAPLQATDEMIAAAEGVEDLYKRGTPQTWARVYRAMLAAAPQPAEREPLAWVVYWGLGRMQKHSVHFEKATADEVAARIKSHTEVRPLVALPLNAKVSGGGAFPPSA